MAFNSSDLVSYITSDKLNAGQPIQININNNTNNYSNSNNKTVNLTGVKYAAKHYDDAPLLRFQRNNTSKKLFDTKKPELEDKEDFADENSIGELEIEDLNEKENNAFVGNIKYYHDRNELIRVFTNFIIRYYKKEDKGKQSLHVIDSARQKFIYFIKSNLEKM